MLLIIFGAGASYDSWSDKALSDRTGRIPLADDLFHTDYARFVLKQMRPILPLLRRRPEGITVENRLEEFQGEVAQSPTRAQQLMAIRFYLSSMVAAVEEAWVKESGAVSNYRTLFDELNLLLPSDPVAFVTFNYDTLLERAIESDSPRRFTQVPDYSIPTEQWNLYKLHGSLGWFRRAETPEPPPTRGLVSQRQGRESLITQAPSIVLTDEWTKSAATFGRLAVPAVAVPLESKQDFECPPDHIGHLKALLPKVDRILSIGWRATDEPFLNLLRDGASNVKHVECVTMKSPEPLGRLTGALAADVAGTAYLGGFSQYIVNRQLKRTLAAA
jgi:hypothetical protein